MRRKQSPANAEFRHISHRLRKVHALILVAVVLTVFPFVTGCSISPLTKPAAAFSNAASVVVENSTNAYRAAIDLHADEQASAGVLKFYEGVAWDPHNDTPLISDEGLAARLAVLDSLKTYAQSLSDVTSGVDSSALDKAAAANGSNLESVGTALASEPSTSKLGLSVGSQTADGVSKAAKALGEYLVAQKIKSKVPEITRKMDPEIEALCKLLTDDVDILRAQSRKDYEDLFRQQEVLIKKDLKASGIRDEIAKLPVILRNERRTDAMLTDLQSAITCLAQTHHALATIAPGKGSESLQAHIADLEAAAENLGKSYQNLPVK